MRDPQASLGRRAWVSCERCPDGAGCADCDSGRTCERHWRFLLHAEGRHVFLQCPACEYRWWQDTRFGVGDRPPRVTELPQWPDGGSQVA